MNLEDLQVFVAVCQAQNLSAVARNLGCTQPAVSQRITRLEKALGTRLLERRPRGVGLTESGRLFYEYVQEGLDAIHLAEKRVRQLVEGEADKLSICTGGTTVRHLMKDAVARFRQTRPTVELVFYSANSHQRCIDALRTEKADLAFVTISAPVRGLEQKPALTVPWVLVVPEGNPLEARSEVSLQELRSMSFIRLKESSTSQAQLELALAEENIRLQSSAQVDDWDTAILLAGMGMGYAIAPAIHAQRLAATDRVKSIPITGLPAVEFGWAYRRWSSLPKVAALFMSTFAQSTREQGTQSANDETLTPLSS